MSAKGQEWFAPARPDLLIAAGQRGQNAAAIATLLDCLERRLPVHASLSGIRPADDIPAPMIYCQSSGSGGRVKTIRRRHASWIASFEVNRVLLGVSSWDRYGILGQLGHSLSLYATMEAAHLGAGLVVLAGDNPQAQMQQLGDTRVSVIYATPSQLWRLQLAAGSGGLPDVAHIICGGGKLDDACRDGIAALCPNAEIREFYGASETSFITLADSRTPAGSVGRPYPGVNVKLDDSGRIHVASPYLFDGYAEPDLPDLPRDEAHLGTGDIGRLDSSGNLFLSGRENRMITVADRNLFLEDVEATMRDAGAGLCAAIAVPDPARGNAVIAVVEGPADDELAARLRRACRDRLGDHAAPRRVMFLPRLPVLASDKPDLAALALLVRTEG
ncbi:AMP-binding protein [Paracoccus caeni]|uniref:AMP-binding protein n=1 Tax=Paracoccus caeni TaxID=657651 RepID=UPI001F2C7581|nr:AMP-binding protein [Paracoccus caeni]